MSTSVFHQISTTLRDLFSRATDFLARLSFWRFVGLCILLMIAAGLANDVLIDDSKRHRSVVKIHKKAPPPKSVPAEPSSLPTPAPDNLTLPGPTPPPIPQDPSPSAEPQNNEISINIKKDGVVITGSKDIERIAKKIEKQIEEESAAEADTDSEIDLDIHTSRPDLPRLAFLLVVLMLIVRFVANSKLRAEAKAAVAIEAADHATLKQQLAEARLQAMQAQVEPHFLFNTLAAVEHLIETDPPRAAKMQRNLIGYLRSVMPNLRKRDSTLGREVEICRHYLEILKVRMEDRLDVVIDVPTGLESAGIPPLMLQSLVENSIHHGLEPKAEGGQVRISAEVRDGKLAVTVADTGTGFAPTATPSKPGGGVGLTSIRERLVALYGDAAQLVITPNEPCGTQVRIDLPYTVTNT